MPKSKGNKNTLISKGIRRWSAKSNKIVQNVNEDLEENNEIGDSDENEASSSEVKVPNGKSEGSATKRKINQAERDKNNSKKKSKGTEHHRVAFVEDDETVLMMSNVMVMTLTVKLMKNQMIKQKLY